MRGRAMAFFGRHPLFGAALAAAVCVALADQGAARGVVAAGLVAAAAWAGLSWRFAVAWFLCGLVAVAAFGLREAGRLEDGARLLGSPRGVVEGKVLEDGRGANGFWAAPVRLADGAKVSWHGSGEPPVAGACLRASGGFRPLPGPRNPGEFDQGRWLRRQGVAAVFRESRAGGGEVETGWLAEWSAGVRRGFRDAVTAGLDDASREARVIRAVVIGERPPDGDEVVAAFRHSGTLHVFCVSGLHVGMIGLAGWWFLRFCGVSRRVAAPLLIAGMFGYAWLTGNGAPAVRAAWMGALFLGAFVFRRKPDMLNAWGAALLAAVIWDGNLLFQPGVQMSYGVVLAILAGVAVVRRVFDWMAEPELYLPVDLMSRWQRASLWIRRQVAGMLTVSSAAWLGSTPLTVWHFGLVTPASIPASVMLMPLVFALLLLAIVSAALHPVLPQVSRCLNQANAWVAKGCAGVAGGFAAIPGSHARVGSDSRPFLLVYDLDYGAGAACFSAGGDGAVLIDCGDGFSFKRRVLPSLRQLGVEPDSVVLSHSDGGHLGGGAEVWESLPVKQVWLPVERSRSPSFRAWKNQAPEAGVAVARAEAGNSLPFPGGARLEILHVPDPLAVNSIADERVAVFRLHWEGWRLLFTNDAGHSTEQAMLDAGVDVAADVIIVGRHREDGTLGDEFLDAVRPLCIVATNAEFPVEERMPEWQVDYWRSRGITVLDQAETGGVTLRVDAAGCLVLEGFADGSARRLRLR